MNGYSTQMQCAFRLKHDASVARVHAGVHVQTCVQVPQATASPSGKYRIMTAMPQVTAIQSAKWLHDLDGIADTYLASCFHYLVLKLHTKTHAAKGLLRHEVLVPIVHVIVNSDVGIVAILPLTMHARHPIFESWRHAEANALQVLYVCCI